MSDMHHYETAISTIISNKDEEEVILRGHRLSDLIRNNSYADSVFLMLSGRMPTKGEARALDALMTACVTHGVSPSASIGRSFASYGTTIPQALAAGILMYGDIAGGAGDPLARLMTEGMREARPDGGDVGDETIASVADRLVTKMLAAGGGRVPGFGIALHAEDPRVPALLAAAQEHGQAGVFCRLLIAMEESLAKAKRRRIPANLDGAVAALMLDFGFPEGCAAALVMIARSYSTLAHHLEEKTKGTKWRHVPQECVKYTGPMPSSPRVAARRGTP
jgi:citrate synthase